LVGRSAELSALQAQAEAARGGRLRVAVLAGEAGAGKTRLADELATVAAARGFRIARACAVPGAPAWWPWQQILAGLGADPPPAAADGFAGTVGYARAVLDCAATGPLLIVLDDLDQADPATAAVLTHLTDLAPASPLLLLAACRDPAGPRDLAGSSALRLPSGPAVHRAHLAGLAAAGVGELLGELLGRPVPPPLAAQLRQRTGGNPGLVLAVAGQLDPDATGHERLTIRWPDPERAEAERQLARLDHRARTALATAAVIGREFDLAILERVLAGAGDLVRTLDEAVRAGLLVALPEQVYSFAQALLREVLYDSFRTPERARLHAAVAEALTSFAGQVGERGPTVAELAHHFGEAAVPGGAELLDRAIGYAVAAATVATEEERHYDAVAHHAAAVRLAVRADWPAAPLGRLLVGLGVARLATGAVVAGREALAAAVRLGRQQGDAGLLAAAALGYGPRAGQWATAPPVDRHLVELLDEVLAATGSLPPSVVGRLRARLAVELADGDPGGDPGDPGRAARLAADGLAAARESADPRAIAEALLAGHATGGVAGPDPAPPGAARQAVREATALGDPALQVRARLALAGDLLATGAVAAADREPGGWTRRYARPGRPASSARRSRQRRRCWPTRSSSPRCTWSGEPRLSWRRCWPGWPAPDRGRDGSPPSPPGWRWTATSRRWRRPCSPTRSPTRPVTGAGRCSGRPRPWSATSGPPGGAGRRSPRTRTGGSCSGRRWPAVVRRRWCWPASICSWPTCQRRPSRWTRPAGWWVPPPGWPGCG
jgi:hypothetical protein